MKTNEDLSAFLVRAEIIDTVIGFANAFDAHDWSLLRSFLAEELWTDYAELRNEPPGVVSADAYVESRKSSLDAIRTLHVSTNHQVSVSGRTATCLSAYQIYRVDPGVSTSDNFLITAGQYEHGLTRAAGRWLIDRIRQTVVYRTGSADVHGALR